jgi:hypothetical protein
MHPITKRGRVKTAIAAVVSVIGLLVVAAVGFTLYKQRQEVDSTPDEQKLARTLEIIRTSTPADHKVIKVLFYGQSITRSGWDKAVIEHWHQAYPNTVFVVANRALGGFSSLELERTTDQDIAAFYPDLIIFHVYGDHRAYERIIRMFRSRTAADILVQTDHGEVLPDPPCSEGLRLTPHRPPGCSGILWLKQTQWHDEMSYHKIPAFAKKYGLAMEPQRIWWRDYLLRTHIQPQSMLVDDVHPNDQGKSLIASFFNQYFDSLVQKWNGQQESNVSSIPVNVGTQGNGQQTLSFNGSRIELLTSKPLAAYPQVSIDGAPPTSLDGCFQVTRASSVGTVPDWPSVRRVTLNHDHVAEDWTATLTNIAPDQKTFAFTVVSSKSGDEGSGDSAHTFTSRDGHLTIEPQDWMFERAYALKHIPIQAPFEVHWSVTNACDGSPETIDLGNGATQFRYVLATALPNTNHNLLLTYPGNDLASAIEFRVYKPPLRP